MDVYPPSTIPHMQCDQKKNVNAHFFYILEMREILSDVGRVE